MSSGTAPAAAFPLVEYTEQRLRLLESLGGNDRGQSAPTTSPEDSRELDAVLANMAATGQSCYPWQSVKRLVSRRCAQTLDRLYNQSGFKPEDSTDDFAVRRDELLRLVEEFPEAPFTLQRLCEILLDTTHYTRTNALLFALEKMLNVCTTQRSLSLPEVAEYNRAVSEADASAAVSATAGLSPHPQRPPPKPFVPTMPTCTASEGCAGASAVAVLAVDVVDAASAMTVMPRLPELPLQQETEKTIDSAGMRREESEPVQMDTS